MRPKTFRVRLHHRQRLNKKFYLLTFALVEPKTIVFQPGQYLSLKIAENRRNSYSITSLPDQKRHLQICVDISPSGPGSQFLKTAPLGTETEVLAPLGRFTLSQEKRPSLFVATGSGISPFRPMITQRLKEFSRQPVHLYWGLRYSRDIFWQKDCQSLEKAFSQFMGTICLSQPNDSWRGMKGRVTEAINQKYNALADWEAYLCGNGAMVDDMRQLLIQKEMKPERIYTERFF